MKIKIIRRIRFWGLIALLIFAFGELIIFDSQRLRILDSIENIQNDVKGLSNGFTNIVQLLEGKPQAWEQRFQSLDQRLKALEPEIERLKALEPEIERLKALEPEFERFKKLEYEFGQLKDSIRSIDKRLQALEEEIKVVAPESEHKKLRRNK